VQCYFSVKIKPTERVLGAVSSFESTQRTVFKIQNSPALGSALC
jgi:hypothetical protein